MTDQTIQIAPYYGVGRRGAAGLTLLGTAFGLTGGLFATAAHVTDYKDDELHIVIPNCASLDDFQDTSIREAKAFPASIVKIDPIRDIALLRWGQGPPPTLGVLSSFSECQVASPVSVVGFPHMDAGRFVVTVQNSIVGAKCREQRQSVSVKHAVINIQASRGQSGSPVLDPVSPTQPSRIYGIVVGPYVARGSSGIVLGNIDPATLHSTTYAVDACYISEMLK